MTLNKIEIKGNGKGSPSFGGVIQLSIDGAKLCAVQEATLRISPEDFNRLEIKTVGEIQDISIEGIVHFITSDGRKFRVVEVEKK